MALAEKIVEIKELAQPVSNQHRLVICGDEPSDMLFEKHLVLFNVFEDQGVSVA
jgi:hypothetical protein